MLSISANVQSCFTARHYIYRVRGMAQLALDFNDILFSKWTSSPRLSTSDWL